MFQITLTAPNGVGATVRYEHEQDLVRLLRLLLAMHYRPGGIAKNWPESVQCATARTMSNRKEG